MNLIYLCKGRLVGIDRILPILMEIKKIKPSIRPLIVFLNEQHKKDIKLNHHIWEAMESLDCRYFVSRGRNKLITSVIILKFILMLSFQYNIIMMDGKSFPAHDFTMGVLKKVSRLVKIKVSLGVQIPYYAKRLAIQQELNRERKWHSQM